MSGLLCACVALSTQVLFTVTLVYSFTTVSVVPGIVVSSCLAVLFTTFIVADSNGFIVTLNVNVLVSPASKCTSIPLFNCVSVYVVFPIFMLFSTKVVPVGTVSDNLTVPSSVPLFVVDNVYVIVSNSCNGLSALTDVPSACIPTLLFIVEISAYQASVGTLTSEVSSGALSDFAVAVLAIFPTVVLISDSCTVYFAVIVFVSLRANEAIFNFPFSNVNPPLSVNTKLEFVNIESVTSTFFNTVFPVFFTIIV